MFEILTLRVLICEVCMVLDCCNLTRIRFNSKYSVILRKDVHLSVITNATHKSIIGTVLPCIVMRTVHHY